MKHINAVTRRHPAHAQVDDLLQIISIVSAIISLAGKIRELFAK